MAQKDNKKQIGEIIPVKISEEMKDSYLDYGMSVIVSRALPDVRDGLKPVHRRILYAMKGMNLTHSARFTKSAKIVGETMGKYHPHGDGPIYQALVRMAQDFSMRYQLVDGQGNFGSIDGDPPAAMRYTEAKMEKITNELLADLEKDTVKFRDNFDGTLKEPTYLPAKIPNLLLMGGDGIAVGMATKIPTHNLSEVIDALVFILKTAKLPREQKGKEFDIQKIDLLNDQDKQELPEIPLLESDATIEQLMKYIKGPDFPTGASIYNQEEITKAYTTGKGKILIRAKATIEDAGHGKSNILITEIPYQVNKSRLIEKIAKLVKDQKIKGVTDLRDESDQRGLQIVVELKRKTRPKVVLNKLYKYTKMQTSYPANMVALVDGIPKLLSLKQILVEFLHHRQQIITRRTFFELKAAKKRAHILEGLKIALDNLDAVIETIKKSEDANKARINLMEKFKLTELQAEAILQMRLRRLAALERKKIEDEYKEINKKIKYLTTLLEEPKKILEVIKEELTEIKKEYGDERKTKVFPQKIKDLSELDLVPSEDCLVILTRTGYIKRLAIETYRSQRRGGKGVSGMTTKEEDIIAHLFTCNTHDSVFFFTNKGRVFSIPAWQIPQGSRQSKGKAIINLINIETDELIQAALPITKKNKIKNVVIATKKGMVKKTALEDYDNIRSSGIIAINLKKGDQLCSAGVTRGNDHILLVTHNGKSIRFKETDARPMGRDTMGVKGINLKKGDYVVNMESFPAKGKKPKDKRRKFFRHILTVAENGLGKRTKLKHYPVQKRAGVGVKVANITKKSGKVVMSKLITQNHKKLILTSKKAQVIKLPIKNIPVLKRNTQGVILMRFSKKGDKVAAATCI